MDKPCERQSRGKNFATPIAGSTGSFCSTPSPSFSESEISDFRSSGTPENTPFEISDIIQDLVVERFTDTLTYYKLRRLRRKQKKLDPEASSISTSAASSMENIIEKLQIQEEIPESKEAATVEDAASEEMARKSVLLYHVMAQTSKALRFCQSRQEFFGSAQHVEAERLLLFAAVRREAILEELRRENVYENLNPHSGTVKISTIIFRPRRQSKKDTTCWFICLLKNGPKIFCTEAVAEKENSVEFPGDFAFENLETYFEIEICLYVLETHKKENERCVNCLFNNGKNYYPDYIAEPNFKLAAKTAIRIADLKKDTLKLTWGEISLKIEAKVTIGGKFTGFLTVGAEKRGTTTWSRRFCCLDGGEFKYWNYPQDEGEIPPLEVLNLKKCATGLVDVAERSLCPRPRTLLLETYEYSGIYKTILRHFLSADSMEEMNMWREKINGVVLSLRAWGEQRTEPFNKCSQI